MSNCNVYGGPLRGTGFVSFAAVMAMCFLGGHPALAAKSKTDDFTPEQVAAIGKIAGEYVASHPQVLLAANQRLQDERRQAQRRVMVQAALGHQKALLRNADTPALGPQTAKVAVIEFFDYQCIYCAKMAPLVDDVVTANPSVRFIFKAFPIFASRWPASQAAAAAGQAVWASKGAEGYRAYHNGLFATGKNEGNLATADIDQLLAVQGIVLDAQGHRTPDTYLAQIAANIQLGQALGLSGTPAFVVMPQEGANVDNTLVLPGAVSASQLQAAIELAGGKAK
ncbi:MULTISPECIES: thioredoxin domain-containing protein [Edwardsiella]|uniref:DSBA oxidoreductase n=2 Tax=Edwardsiella anguillarum TaxID=1821960 RepID=A0A076LEZ6_9GAMM|nr:MULTISPECIES: thioredoxin domain-containing protein [Edwardsiella]GAJ66140.1 DSBA oxidoreductase [Edwardsiella piscicida]AIJ06751.1 DSBA oxidoreductase [Edwardsiella anguillarum ET080813]AKR78229.2 thioredoxin domain-containing protein [Edwardsiella sp. LADL05-105]UOU77927.1 thioredoxin domain-containing protein [Edwardsiella anguillarum]WHP79141.1 thioredoxin domain-containing protein [Edwardsiella anguillarum]